MDSHFNAYKARYEILDNHIKFIQHSQYIRSMDIFINLDDIFHIMHRPIVEKEVEACGMNAVKQCAVHIINLMAHYKQWAAKRHIRARVYGIYTSTMRTFKNRVYIPTYRDYFASINDPVNKTYFLVNDTISKAISIAKNIADYVEGIFIIDSHYLEPSIIPLYLTESGVASYEWKMMVSRDLYDLQYAYRDKWIFVSPKGDNTRIITRGDLWKYIAAREHIQEVGKKSAYYDLDIFPLALTVSGNKLRNVPRLRRIGWGTIFKYLDGITEKDTSSLQILSSRFLDLLGSKGVQISQVENNLACVSIASQTAVMNDIDRASINDQLKYVTDHEALTTINDLYFQQFPLNIPFLLADYRSAKPFF